MAEWNRIFRLFRFSGILGQPREVLPKFRNEIPENVCSIRLTNPEVPEFLVEWKAPIISGKSTLMLSLGYLCSHLDQSTCRDITICNVRPYISFHPTNERLDYGRRNTRLLSAYFFLDLPGRKCFIWKWCSLYCWAHLACFAILSSALIMYWFENNTTSNPNRAYTKADSPWYIKKRTREAHV